MYIGHTDGDRIQTLEEHLKNTAKLAAFYASSFGMEAFGEFLGENHDLGKFGTNFQEYIQGKKKKGGDHSTAGALYAWCRRKELGPAASIAAFCISGHHSGLLNQGSKTNTDGEKTLWGRLKKDIPEYEKISSYGIIEKLPDVAVLGRFVKDNMDLMMLTRMLFSCLVDADFLDTENFMNQGKRERGGFQSIEDLHRRFFEQLEVRGYLHPANDINKKRYEILKTCMEKGKGEAGLYSLTVPTGGGKTISSMAFAMNQALTQKKKRIIYVIPYLSIIDQTAKIFKDFLGKENVLESHSNVSYDDMSENIAERNKLATENWDAPVVITTNEQFWESLYSNRTSKCRKLHNIVNSVIIFDEAQMLPLEFLKPCLKGLEELVNYYGCTALLCSATQPELGKYMTQKPVEIMENIPELYQYFNRVTYQFDGVLTYDDIAEKLKSSLQSLCIASTKKEAEEIFSRMEGKDNFYLSTNLCPMHRMKVIEEIKERLQTGAPCRVVSTSVISVGVDVDFPVVYLEYTGLDSLIQGAGRCNREGKKAASKSIAHIFRTEKEKGSHFMQKEKQVTEIIRNTYKMDEIGYPAAIRSYYESWYQNNEGNMDYKNILQKSDDFAFEDIGKSYHLIESMTKSVFIPLDEKAKKIAALLDQGIRTRDLMRGAAQYMVNVRFSTDNNTKAPFRALMEQGIIRYFQGDSEMALLVNEDAYDDKEGLKTEDKEGVGIMW